MPNYLTPEWQRADQRVPTISCTLPYTGACSEQCAVLVRDEANPEDGLITSLARYTVGREWYVELDSNVTVLWWFELPSLPRQP